MLKQSKMINYDILIYFTSFSNFFGKTNFVLTSEPGRSTLPYTTEVQTINFFKCVEVDISGKKLPIGRSFEEKSRDHIHNVIYRPQFQRGIFNVSF